MDQGRGLKGLTGGVAGHLVPGDGAQLIVDGRPKPLVRMVVAPPDGGQKLRHRARR